MFDQVLLQSRIDDLCRSIHRPSPKLIALDSKTPIAAVLLLPGRGIIFLSKGLILRLEGNLEELDAVILHELAHVFHCDGIFRLFALWAFGLFLAWGCVLVVGLSSSWTISIGILLVLLSLALIGREQEYRADFTAASWMKTPDPLVRALNKIEPKYSTHFFRDIFSSHPPVEKRIERLYQSFVR